MQPNELRDRERDELFENQSWPPKKLDRNALAMARERRLVNRMSWVVLFICAVGLTAIYWPNH